jgi:hypothetical protein
MASITQTVESFLGGVSKQADDKKLPGQVTDCINGYIDPTFGLTKRPGTKFIKELTGVGSTELDGGRWFYINRDEDEQYLGCITPTGIRIWNTSDGTEATVTTESITAYNPIDYLTLAAGLARNHIQVLTVQDSTFIVNKSKVVGTLDEAGELVQFPSAAPQSFGPDFRNFGYTANTAATIRLKSVEFGAEYKITIDGTPLTTVTTRNGEDPAWDYTTNNAILSISEVIDSLFTIVDAAKPAGSTVIKLRDTIEITGATAAFTITGSGGINGDELEVFQESVNNISDLPSQSVHGRRVTIENTASNSDTYYVKFTAEDGVSGKGYWEEFVKPNIPIHLDPRTMPHELLNTGLNAFTFRPIEIDNLQPTRSGWEQRLVGDEDSNSLPSFVANTINQIFFYNNRLGFLSGDNVILSKAGEFFNFFFSSALTVTAADPIDLSCSSLRPAVLNFVLPVPQGLVLFTDNQQFVLFSDTGVITPDTTAIKSISNYECDRLIDPVDVGTNIVFMSKTPGYSRTYALKTRGFDENPDVLDVGKVVSEYVPDTIDNLQASPQNSFVFMSSASDPFVYFYRTYGDAEQVYIQAWFRWKLAGNVQYCLVDRDDFIAVTKQEGKYTIIRANLTQAPEDRILTTAEGQVVQTCLDMYSNPSSVTYDANTDISTLTLPYTDITDRTPVALVGDGLVQESGYVLTATRGTGNTLEVVGEDLTSIASQIYVGYSYDMEVELPRFYYRKSENSVDYTASLTVARVKVSVKQSSSIEFKLLTNGRTDWRNIQSVQIADQYLANNVPLQDLTIYTVPLHQRNDNFILKLFSDSPFPLSITSMTWEGRYSPRYYSRQ